MDLNITKKHDFVKEWMKICLLEEEYFYVLSSDLSKIVMLYTDYIYEEILKNKELTKLIEDSVDNDVKVFVPGELLEYASDILADLLYYELDYTFQEDNMIWLKGIDTKDEYYEYLFNLVIDGAVPYSVDKINEGNIEINVDFYPCGDFIPSLIVQNNNFNNVVSLFTKEKINPNNSDWSTYKDIKIKIPNGPFITENKRLENLTRKLLMNHDIREMLNT